MKIKLIKSTVEAGFAAVAAYMVITALSIKNPAQVVILVAIVSTLIRGLLPW